VAMRNCTVGGYHRSIVRVPKRELKIELNSASILLLLSLVFVLCLDVVFTNMNFVRFIIV
jgi:hypothetical protein